MMKRAVYPTLALIGILLPGIARTQTGAAPAADAPTTERKAGDIPPSENANRVPILGDLPIVGSLFQSSGDDAAYEAGVANGMISAANGGVPLPMGATLVSLEADRLEGLDAVLRLLNQGSVSYVIGGEMPKGRVVTLHLHDVPLQEALEAVTAASGLHYQVRGSIVILTPGLDVWPAAGSGWNRGFLPYQDSYNPWLDNQWQGMVNINPVHPLDLKGKDPNLKQEVLRLQNLSPAQFLDKLDPSIARNRTYSQVIERAKTILVIDGKTLKNAITSLTLRSDTPLVWITGTPDALQRFKERVHALDLPHPLEKPKAVKKAPALVRKANPL